MKLCRAAAAFRKQVCLKYGGFVHLGLGQTCLKAAFFPPSEAPDITTSRAIKSKSWCSKEKEPHPWKLLSWLHEKSVFCPPVRRWCSLHNSGKAHSWANISIFKAAATVAKLTASKNNLAPGPPSLQPFYWITGGSRLKIMTRFLIFDYRKAHRAWFSI